MYHFLLYAIPHGIARGNLIIFRANAGGVMPADESQPSQKPGPKPRFGETTIPVTSWLPPRVVEWLRRITGAGSDGQAVRSKLIEQYIQATGDTMTETATDASTEGAGAGA